MNKNDTPTDTFELKSIGGNGDIVFVHFAPKSIKGLTEQELQLATPTLKIETKHEPKIPWGCPRPSFS